MEVSSSEIEPGGQELIDTLVDLSGLPDGLIRPEVDFILDQNGQNTGDLTLEQLRTAMIAYLEKIHEDVAEASAVE